MFLISTGSFFLGLFLGLIISWAFHEVKQSGMLRDAWVFLTKSEARKIYKS